jgi:predicted Zn-dependent protease
MYAKPNKWLIFALAITVLVAGAYSVFGVRLRVNPNQRTLSLAISKPKVCNSTKVNKNNFIGIMESNKVILIPLDQESITTAKIIGSQLRGLYKITIGISDCVSFPSQIFDRSRGQLIGNYILGGFIELRKREGISEKVILIGIAATDLNNMERDANFYFSLNTDPRVAVVSTYRMNPVTFGEPENQKLLVTRLRKMVMKNISRFYLGYQSSSNPKSVMNGSIANLNDLDALGEEP